MEEEQEITQILDDIKPMIRTPQQEEEFLKTVGCHICNEDLGADRVRDHDHLTGLFRGAAHNECNLNINSRRILRIAAFSSQSFFTILKAMILTSSCQP